MSKLATTPSNTAKGKLNTVYVKMSNLSTIEKKFKEILRQRKKNLHFIWKLDDGKLMK